MRRILFVTALVSIACAACQKEAAAEQQKATTSKSEAPAKAPAAKANPGNQSYMVRIVPGDGKAGEVMTSVVEVTAGEGYKINLQFPSRLQLEPAAGVKPSKEKLSRGDAEITEKVLRFNVAFTPANPGTLKMTGTTDFSVCNERTCNLFRGEKLAWEVSVK